MVVGSYDFQSFDLYQDHFAWDYQKRWSVGAGLGWQSIDTAFGALAVYTFSNSRLFRNGTFQETFKIDEQGLITPIYRTYNLHEASLSAWATLFGFKATVNANGIMDWSGKNGADTLDSFYEVPLWLDGYPLLKDAENYTRSGMRTLMAELRYTCDVFTDLRWNLGVFTTRSLSVDLFAQMGAAWNEYGWIKDLTKFDFWYRSVGIEWKFGNRLFYTAPFDIRVKLARGLDGPKSTRGEIRIGAGI
jgi:hypothetical protein